MLILARRIGESIMVGDQVEISVVDIKGDQVKLGINAPAQVKVYRREVYAAIQAENRAAAAAAPESLSHLEGLLGRNAPARKPSDRPQPPDLPQPAADAPQPPTDAPKGRDPRAR